MKKNILIIILAILSVILFFLYSSEKKSNSYPTYGETGFPKNCRAIIAANIDGYEDGDYTAAEALGSIDRNCGLYGYSW
ncbi:MAG: kynureninase [bacterium]|nr:kynureninase [bacterium]